MLNRIVNSKHCPGKKAKIVSYDHTGFVEARCDCGKIYTHDDGFGKI